MWRLNVGPDHLETCVDNRVFAVNVDFNFDPGEILLLQLLKHPGVNLDSRIQYYMHFVSKELDKNNETDKYWRKHFKFLVRCSNVKQIEIPFSLENIQTSERGYTNGNTGTRIHLDDLQIVMDML